MNLVHVTNDFYNYVYCDPRKPWYLIKGTSVVLPGEPFYVGRGKGDRKLHHLWEAEGSWKEQRRVRNYKLNKIKKILNCGLKPIVVQLNKDLSNEMANANEEYLVKVIGRFDLGKGPLTNLTNGGETSAGFKMPQESTRRRLITTFKNRPEGWHNPFKGKRHTEEAKQKNRLAHLGKSTGRKGIKTGKAAHNAFPALQLDISNGRVIREFYSCGEIRNVLGLRIDSSVCGDYPKVRGNYSKGFIWIFKKDLHRLDYDAIDFNYKNFYSCGYKGNRTIQVKRIFKNE